MKKEKERERSHVCVFAYKCTDPVYEGSILITELPPKYFTSHVGIRAASTYELGGGHLQSIAPSNSHSFPFLLPVRILFLIAIGFILSLIIVNPFFLPMTTVARET